MYLLHIQLFFGVIIGLSLFVYYSWRPQMRLIAEPPAKFLVGRTEWNAQRSSAEQPLARAYWDCAVKVVQWMYPFGADLPPTPPPEFRIDVRQPPNPAAATPESRNYYWQRLREVWPQAWRRVYEWDTAWVHDRIENLRRRVPSFPLRLGQVRDSRTNQTH